MYIEDLKIFYEKQIVDNQLLLNLMEYAESFAKEFEELKMIQRLVKQVEEKTQSEIIEVNIHR